MPQTEPAILQFIEEFDAQCQRLTRSEKCQLLSVLAIQQQQLEDGNRISVSQAYRSHPHEGSADVDRAVEILDAIGTRSARSLMEALMLQIRHWSSKGG